MTQRQATNIRNPQNETENRKLSIGSALLEVLGLVKRWTILSRYRMECLK